MPIRVYELARDLNYSLDELDERKAELGLIANSPFSLIPLKVEEKIRAKLSKRKPNECLVREKPKRPKKKVAAKPKQRKPSEDYSEDDSEDEYEDIDDDLLAGRKFNDGRSGFVS